MREIFAIHTAKNDKRIDLSDINIYQKQYNAHYRMLKYFGMSYLDDDEAIQDLIQDLWLKLWERKETFKNETTFKYYLIQALRHSILNYLKHNEVIREYAGKELQVEQIEEDISHKMIEAEIYQRINEVFDELPDTCRRVYAASLKGKSQKEIAEEFSISINTVKKHINNANHYMKKRLKHLFLFFLSFR